ncbi:hypothetical protein FB45DRAFT_948072, partial [Roridomyces roridus]
MVIFVWTAHVQGSLHAAAAPLPTWNAGVFAPSLTCPTRVVDNGRILRKKEAFHTSSFLKILLLLLQLEVAAAVDRFWVCTTYVELEL